MPFRCLVGKVILGAGIFAQFLACESGSEPLVDLGDGPCPDCSSVLNESPTDNDLQGICCRAIRATVDTRDPRAAAYRAEDLAAYIQAGYKGPFQWRRSWGGTRARGFKAATELQLSATVQGVDYIDQEPLELPDNPLICVQAACDDYLGFDIHVELNTADGALTGAGDVYATTRNNPEEVAGAANLPIASFSGSLELGVIASQSPPTGAVLTNLVVSTSGVQGTIVPWIAHRTSDGSSSSDGPMAGQWPVPNCVGKGSPVDIDAPLESAPASTIRALFSDVAAQVQETAIVGAIWLDGTSTAVHLELNGDDFYACSDSRDHVVVETPLRLETSDRRLDIMLPATFLIEWNGDVDSPDWTWQIQSEVLDKDAIKRLVASYETDRTVVEGVIEAQGNSEGGYWRIIGNSGVSIDGQLLRWCLSQSCEPIR